MRGHELISLITKIPQLAKKCQGIGTKDEVPLMKPEEFVFVNTE